MVEVALGQGRPARPELDADAAPALARDLVEQPDVEAWSSTVARVNAWSESRMVGEAVEQAGEHGPFAVVERRADVSVVGPCDNRELFEQRLTGLSELDDRHAAVDVAAHAPNEVPVGQAVQEDDHAAWSHTQQAGEVLLAG